MNHYSIYIWSSRSVFAELWNRIIIYVVIYVLLLHSAYAMVEIEKALTKIASENTVREELRSGNTLTDIFAKHKIL